LPRLAGTAYARAAGSGPDLEAVQREVATVTLLQLRLLAGWLPPRALELLRPLAAWFELANIEDRFLYLEGGDLKPAFELGSLAAAWPQAALTQSTEELCRVLAASAWVYQGGADAQQLHAALRLAWAERVLAVAPEARAWVAGAVTLLLARDELNASMGLRVRAEADLSAPPQRLRESPSFDRLRAELPGESTWPLAGLDSDESLWRAEAGWWHRIETEASVLARGPRPGQGVIVGVVALLALDAVRVRAALGAAARGGTATAREAFDALV
jgi:hypothetical protein